MRNMIVILCVGCALAGTAWPQAQELECRIASVGMFKNGLAVITRTVDAPGPGVYIVTNPPEPIHGTFWLESDAAVEARMTTRYRVQAELPTDMLRSVEGSVPGIDRNRSTCPRR